MKLLWHYIPIRLKAFDLWQFCALASLFAPNWVAGRVVNACVHHAPCPVLVDRPPHLPTA